MSKNTLKNIFDRLDSLNHPAVTAPCDQKSSSLDTVSNGSDPACNQAQPKAQELDTNDEQQWKIPKTAKEIQQQLLSIISPEFVNLHPADPKELAKFPDFPCDGCGLCCVRVDSSPYLQELESKRKDGICRYFDLKSKKCLIYEHRPLICNVKECYLALFKDQMSIEEFYLTNSKACNDLKTAYAQNLLLKIPHQKL